MSTFRVIWNLGAAASIFCLFYIMLQAKHWVCNDPLWLRYFRLCAFLVCCALCAYSIGNGEWQVTLPALLTLYGGLLLALTNAISLCLRAINENGNVKTNGPTSLDTNRIHH